MCKLLLADVVVVGAGFSGLQAAIDVQAAGLNVHVFEALDRIGGKSYTKRLLSGPGHVELGCTWINGSTQTRMSALVEKYGLETRKQYLNGVELTLDTAGKVHASKHGEIPSTIDPKEVDLHRKIVQVMKAEHRKFRPNRPGQPRAKPAYPDTSLDKWLTLMGARKGQFAYESVRFFCTGIYGREPDEVGLWPFLEMVESCFDWVAACSDDVGGGQHLKIRTGTTSICERMAAELRPGLVHMNSPITQIHQAGNKCIVSGNNAVVHCSKIIMTVPGTTWDNINFSPPLPKNKREIFEASRAGHYTKMVLTYPTAWWKELGLLGKFTSWAGPISFSWDISDEKYDQYSIAVFVVASDCKGFRELPRLEREKSVLDNIARMVNEEYHSQVYGVLEINEQDWFGEKWIRGVTFPSMGPGKISELGPALKEPFVNIHLLAPKLLLSFADTWKGLSKLANELPKRLCRCSRGLVFRESTLICHICRIGFKNRDPLYHMMRNMYAYHVHE